MSIFPFFNKSVSTSTNEIAEIFPLEVNKTDFINQDILTTYVKILTDTFERTHGLSEEQNQSLWDSCVQTEAKDGLVTLLAEAMTKQSDLYLVYREGVLRKATQEEQQKIIDDYKKQAGSSLGVFVSFKKYRRTQLLLIYSAFEYCVLASLNKLLNLAKAVQLKINELRSSVGLSDSEVAIAQAQSIAIALGKGNDVLLDAKDLIETPKPDTSSTEKSIAFLDAKRAYILGLPMSYITGQETPGMGSSGEADMRAVERGLKQYFVSIVRPVCEELFTTKVKFKSLDFREMTTSLEVLKSFDLVSDELMPKAAKIEIIARVFDLDEQELLKMIADEESEREAKQEEQNANQPRIQPINGQQNTTVRQEFN